MKQLVAKKSSDYFPVERMKIEMMAVPGKEEAGVGTKWTALVVRCGARGVEG